MQDSIIEAQSKKLKEAAAGKGDGKGGIALDEKQQAALENGLPVDFKVGDRTI